MKRFTVLALALAIGLATAASPFASSAPDGLNRIAADKAFAARADAHHAPVAGYAAPGVADGRVAKGVAGFAGTLLVFGLGVGVTRTANRRVRT
jgi:hypothetical protein